MLYDISLVGQTCNEINAPGLTQENGKLLKQQYCMHIYKWENTSKPKIKIID
jgi:hypothetical protein